MVSLQEPVKKKGRTVTSEKVKEESPSFPIKPKPKKQVSTKKDNQTDKSRCVSMLCHHCELRLIFLFICINFIDPSSLELPYVTPLENKQRKSFTPKALYPLANIPKTRPAQKPRRECRQRPKHHLGSLPPPTTRWASDMFDLTVDGKLEDPRPSLLVKLLSSSSVPELGHSSGSEGEKDFAPPEWDVPLSKNSLRETRSQTTR